MWSHVGDSIPPSNHGVPAFAHTTVFPSPMSHAICDTFAVAVTDNPGTDAVAEFGPQVVGDTCVHNHTGTPTRPNRSGGTVIPIAGPANCI